MKNQNGKNVIKDIVKILSDTMVNVAAKNIVGAIMYMGNNSKKTNFSLLYFK
jgi:hypothetical protein